MAAICRTAWLSWPVSVALTSRVGRYLPYGVSVLARVGGPYGPYWPLFALRRGGAGPYRWPLRAVLAVSCRTAWLSWPISVAVMTSIGRYVPYGVAVLARIGGRYELYWPLLAVRGGCSGPWRWPL